jgi:hypothetical protein
MIAQLNQIAQIWWQWMAGMFWLVSLFIILITALDMAIRRWAWQQVRYVLHHHYMSVVYPVQAVGFLKSLRVKLCLS